MRPLQVMALLSIVFALVRIQGPGLESNESSCSDYTWMDWVRSQEVRESKKDELLHFLLDVNKYLSSSNESVADMNPVKILSRHRRGYFELDTRSHGFILAISDIPIILYKLEQQKMYSAYLLSSEPHYLGIRQQTNMWRNLKLNLSISGPTNMRYNLKSTLIGINNILIQALESDENKDVVSAIESVDSEINQIWKEWETKEGLRYLEYYYPGLIIGDMQTFENEFSSIVSKLSNNQAEDANLYIKVDGFGFICLEVTKSLCLGCFGLGSEFNIYCLARHDNNNFYHENCNVHSLEELITKLNSLQQKILGLKVDEVD